jgi:outer membrane protein assembly factor BamB
LWTCDGPADFCATTAVFTGDTVFASGGYPQKTLLAIRADGSGDVTRSHLRWQGDSKIGYVPSPLLRDGLLYGLSDNGLLRCYEAESGKIVWEHALKAPFYSSPVLVGDRIYLFDRDGLGYVVKTGRQFELLATNELADGVFSTPVILGGRIYLRSLRYFYCLAVKP